MMLKGSLTIREGPIVGYDIFDKPIRFPAFWIDAEWEHEVPFKPIEIELLVTENKDGVWKKKGE